MTGASPLAITHTRVWPYAALSLPIAMIGYPPGVWVPRRYASDMGLHLGSIGAVPAATALYDAFTDPVMGFVADRVRTRFGRRRPWILSGVPLFAFGVWMLPRPAAAAARPQASQAESAAHGHLRSGRMR